jgi:hypothetical protein
MNKLSVAALAILGGIEAVFSIAMPILVALLWTKYVAISGQFSEIIIIGGIVSSLFRAIKIGWLNK